MTGVEGVTVVLGLVLLVLAVVVVSSRLGIAYPILLVLVGSALALVPGLPQITLSPEVFLFGVLPPLVFATALGTSPYELRANSRVILALAVGLVLLTMGAVGAVTHLAVPGIGWAAALTLGAIVAPPDPVATAEVAGRVGLPSRLTSILEGEGLINDGTALTAYQVTIGAVAGTVSVLGILFDFGRAVVVGLAMGFAVAWVFGRLVRRTSDALVVNTLLLLVPFVGYLAADVLGGSGVLAVVMAALFSQRDNRSSLDAAGRLQQQSLWQLVSFLLTGASFMLVGLQLRGITASLFGAGAGGNGIGGPGRTVTVLAVVTLTVLVVRFVGVFGFALRGRWRRQLHDASARRHGRQGGTAGLADAAGSSRRSSAASGPGGWRQTTVVSWSGMRGAVSLAAALALPADFPFRDLILAATFAVILVTLVLQGLTLAPLVRALHVVSPEAEQQLALLSARRDLEAAALDRLGQFTPDTPETPESGDGPGAHGSAEPDSDGSSEDGADDRADDATADAHDEAVARFVAMHRRRLSRVEHQIDTLRPDAGPPSADAGDDADAGPGGDARADAQRDRAVAREAGVIATQVRDAQRERLDQLERAGRVDGEQASGLRRHIDQIEAGTRSAPRSVS